MHKMFFQPTLPLSVVEEDVRIQIENMNICNIYAWPFIYIRLAFHTHSYGIMLRQGTTSNCTVLQPSNFKSC